MSQSRISAGNKTDRRCDDDIIGMRGKDTGNLFKPGRVPKQAKKVVCPIFTEQ
jgi:hypothetical protein